MPRQVRHLHLIVVILFVIGLVGCPKTDQIKGNVNLSTQQLLKTIVSKRQVIQSLEGRAKLRIYLPNKKRRTLRMYFQIQRPNRIHLQVIAAAMQPVLVVTSDGKTFAIHNMLRQEFMRGKASQLPNFLGDFLPTQISVSQLVAALLGEIPLLPHKTLTTSKPSTGNLLLSMTDPAHSQKIWIDTIKKQFKKTEIASKRRSPLILEYGTYRGKPALPKRIKFIMPKKKKRVHWIFSQRLVNPKLTLKSFQQKTPKGLKVRNL